MLCVFILYHTSAEQSDRFVRDTTYQQGLYSITPNHTLLLYRGRFGRTVFEASGDLQYKATPSHIYLAFVSISSTRGMGYDSKFCRRFTSDRRSRSRSDQQFVWHQIKVWHQVNVSVSFHKNQIKSQE